MAERRPPEYDWRGAWDRLVRRDIHQTALVAFIVGVLFHVCVVYAVLGGDGGDSATTTPFRPTVETTTQRTPTRLPDRTDCAEIRGSDYRSENERLWFIRNCTTGQTTPGIEGASSG